jgi:hypothetical protein
MMPYVEAVEIHRTGLGTPGDTPARARFGTRGVHRLESLSTPKRRACGCGAVVAHHLAKVRVASSNLVIRSKGNVPRSIPVHRWRTTTVEWPRGEAAACKAVHAGSNPVSTSPKSAVQHDRQYNTTARAIGAAVARFPDTEEVAGSIPVSLTREKAPVRRGFSRFRGLLRPRISSCDRPQRQPPTVLSEPQLENSPTPCWPVRRPTTVPISSGWKYPG